MATEKRPRLTRKALRETARAIVALMSSGDMSLAARPAIPALVRAAKVRHWPYREIAAWFPEERDWTDECWKQYHQRSARSRNPRRKVVDPYKAAREAAE